MRQGSQNKMQNARQLTHDDHRRVVDALIASFIAEIQKVKRENESEQGNKRDADR